MHTIILSYSTLQLNPPNYVNILFTLICCNHYWDGWEWNFTVMSHWLSNASVFLYANPFIFKKHTFYSSKLVGFYCSYWKQFLIWQQYLQDLEHFQQCYLKYPDNSAASIVSSFSALLHQGSCDKWLVYEHVKIQIYILPSIYALFWHGHWICNNPLRRKLLST